MRPKSPCYACEDRKPGCHDKCDKYQDFKEKNDALKKIIREEKKKNLDPFFRKQR